MIGTAAALAAAAVEKVVPLSVVKRAFQSAYGNGSRKVYDLNFFNGAADFRTRVVLRIGDRKLLHFVLPWNGILVWHAVPCHHIDLLENETIAFDVENGGPDVRAEIFYECGGKQYVECFHFDSDVVHTYPLEA